MSKIISQFNTSIIEKNVQVGNNFIKGEGRDIFLFVY